MEGDTKVSNPDFKLEDAKAIRNRDIGIIRSKCYPPISELGNAIYHEKKGDNSYMNQYISDCDKVKTDHPLVE